MVSLVAKERFPYAGGELLPGQRFEDSDVHGRILTALGKAEYDSGTQTPPPPAGASAPEPRDDASSLREEARALGVKVDGRWSKHRLRTEMDAARAGRYLRRDIRAED